MKKFKLLYLLGLFSLMFTACNNDNDEKEYVYSKKVFLRANMETFISQASNSENTGWENESKLGVYLSRGEGLSEIVEGAQNKQFQNINESELFWSVDSQNDIFYPKDDKSFNIVAYSPYSAALEGEKYMVKVSDQSTQKSIDLLYSDNAKNVESAATQPTLVFKHQLSKVVFNLVATGGLPTLKGTSLKMQNMPLEAEFNLANTALSQKDAKGFIDTKVTLNAEDPTKAISEAIVIPSEINDAKIIITYVAAGKTVEYEWNAGKLLFEKGKKYSFDIEIDAQQGVLVRPTSTIVDWEGGSDETIDIDINTGGENEDEVVTLLEENFGGAQFSSPWKKVAEFDKYDNKDVTYSDPYEKKWADIRWLEKPNIWFPAANAQGAKECGFKIDGLPANRKKMKLEYQLLAQNPSVSTIIKVKANGTEVAVPEVSVDKDKANWTTVVISLPDNTTSIEFYSGAENTIGFRVAAIKIEGTKK